MISTPVTLWPLLFSWMLSTAYHCWRGLQYGVSYNPSQFSSDVIGRQWTNKNPVKCMKLREIAGKRMRPSHADYSRTYPVFFREGVPEMVVPCDAADAWLKKTIEQPGTATFSGIDIWKVKWIEPFLQKEKRRIPGPLEPLPGYNPVIVNFNKTNNSEDSLLRRG